MLNLYIRNPRAPRPEISGARRAIGLPLIFPNPASPSAQKIFTLVRKIVAAGCCFAVRLSLQFDGIRLAIALL